MQKLTLALAVWLAVAGLPLSATAAVKAAPGGALPQQGERTVGVLLATCETQTVAAQNWCSAYLMGAADTLSVFGTSGFKGGLCAANYKVTQLTPMFVSWARKHPDMSNFEMLAGVTLAFHEAWPCQ